VTLNRHATVDRLLSVKEQLERDRGLELSITPLYAAGPAGNDPVFRFQVTGTALIASSVGRPVARHGGREAPSGEIPAGWGGVRSVMKNDHICRDRGVILISKKIQDEFLSTLPFLLPVFILRVLPAEHRRLFFPQSRTRSRERLSFQPVSRS